MILTCPACGTRYNVDETKFPSQGRTVRCAKCGHSWHQVPPGPEPQPDLQPEPAPAAAAAADAARGGAPDPVEATPSGHPGASGTRAYAPAAQIPEKPRGQGLQTAAVALGWLGLIAVVLLIGWSAVRYRQDIATVWPQSAGVYDGLGLAVNAGGVGFADVAYKRETEDGQPVLVVTGAIVNTSSRELPVPPSVRVTLTDADNRELYHWPFKPDAQTLKPGARLAFRTRLASPPAAARAATVSFSKDGT